MHMGAMAKLYYRPHMVARERVLLHETTSLQVAILDTVFIGF